ncbi:probable serine/threonine-protein kinase mps1 [Corticium candelabrum]|uniref:probable serine/threonine-protein kinase mps1 n=1 Tax=Corticium candelabrum TaxID=121492 RepID=UPI002E276F70|nr:probable serine/threonine-protein kinase mps1 [Corticium candelabrum]
MNFTVEEIITKLKFNDEDSSATRTRYERLLRDHPLCAYVYVFFAEFELSQGNREGSIKMLKTGVRKKAQPFGLMRAAQDNIWNSRPVLDDSLLATIRNTSSSSSDSSSMHNTQPTTITKSLQTVCKDDSEVVSAAEKGEENVDGTGWQLNYYEEGRLQSMETQSSDNAIPIETPSHHPSNNIDTNTVSYQDPLSERVTQMLQEKRSHECSSGVKASRKPRRRRHRGTQPPALYVPVKSLNAHEDNKHDKDALTNADNNSLPGWVYTPSSHVTRSLTRHMDTHKSNTVCGMMSPELPVVRNLPARSVSAIKMAALDKKETTCSDHKQPSCQSLSMQTKTTDTFLKMQPPGQRVAIETCENQDERWKEVVMPRGHELSMKKENQESGNRICINRNWYEKVGVLGSGASSRVFSAVALNSITHDPVAIKCVDLSVVSDKAVRDTFMQEIAVLEELNKGGCKHIIKLHEWEYREHNMMLYIVMEKGDKDLSCLIKETGALPLWKVQAFWSNMLEAVQAIHRFKIIHSDLKPANFIVFNGYSLKLIDFGIADKIENERTSIQRDLEKGTPNYMAPEAIRAGCNAQGVMKVGPSSDIWSLGCILYSMLYGHAPFSHIRQMKLMAITDNSVQIDFPPLSIPDSQNAIDMLKRCLQRNPKQRATVEELLNHPWLVGTQAVELSTAKRPAMVSIEKPPVANHNHLVHDQQQDLREINSHAIRIARAGLKPLAVSQNKKYMKIQQAELKENMGLGTLLKNGLKEKYKNAMDSITETSEQSSWSLS